MIKKIFIELSTHFLFSPIDEKEERKLSFFLYAIPFHFEKYLESREGRKEMNLQTRNVFRFIMFKDFHLLSFPSSYCTQSSDIHDSIITFLLSFQFRIFFHFDFASFILFAAGNILENSYR